VDSVFLQIAIGSRCNALRLLHPTFTVGFKPLMQYDFFSPAGTPFVAGGGQGYN
jgi:hypothetical protein